MNVTAVLGACSPERARYAAELASATRRELLTAARLSLGLDPVFEAEALLPWYQGDVVAEFPLTAEPTALIGSLADPKGPTVLDAVVCVVDVSHLVDDLRDDADIDHWMGPLNRLRLAQTSRALLTVLQIEYATVIVLVNWTNLTTAKLSTVMALLSHLAPHARLRLDTHGSAPIPGAPPATHNITNIPLGLAQDGPGWVATLNDEHHPYMTDARVSAIRYEQLRPFHPERLDQALEDLAERRYGTIVRSAGFCRLATRPHRLARWEHVGTVITFNPLSPISRLMDADDLAAIGQDIAFIGLDLTQDKLFAALDHASLADHELADGPEGWSRFHDPFPRWPRASVAE